METEQDIWNCSGSVFFDKLEKCLLLKIPDTLRNILVINDIDCASVLESLNDNYLQEIEKFMKNEFHKDIAADGKTIGDYLGIFSKRQQHFTFTCGQRIMLNKMIQYCQRYVRAEIQNQVPNTIDVETVYNGVNIPSDISVLNSTFEDETFQQPMSKIDEMIRLSHYIGALMITVYNDAKRTSLSAWSFPSRHIAAEMASNYQVNGKVEEWKPNFQYVTPSQHPEFLNCIVQSDLNDFVFRLKNAWAVSLRVDGSVDRSQKHNVFVMANVVYKNVDKNVAMSTVFLGFKVPKDGQALAYFDSVKEVVGNILPWEEFLTLISSIVTDGENLNKGDENGLWVRVQRCNTTNKPILPIWCIDHRFNLGWKDLCDKSSLVKNLITDASRLSTYFHRSGGRTKKLEDAAEAKGLPTPLHYLEYFEVRWTQFVFDLFNVTLRNWRAAMHYFIRENENGLSNRWLLYDRIHILAFMTDVLCLLKTLQKTFESDSISILDVQPKKEKLLTRLNSCIDEPVAGGWEQEFLSNVQTKADGLYFYGHKLLINNARSTRTATCSFTATDRRFIIETLVDKLNTRLDYDIELQKNLEPLSSIKSLFSNEKLKSCYDVIVPDLDENNFYAEYLTACNLLMDYNFESPLKTLQKLEAIRPGELSVLKTALARVVAAKPHSSDVERLICTYNKIKDKDRYLSAPTLFSHLYVNINMPPLSEFDPTDAVKYWMAQKNRNPVTSSKSRQQEWFGGVFAGAKERKHKQINPIIRF